METVVAAVKIGPSKMELREFPMPEIPEDGALLKMEVAGICGTDVKMYKQPLAGGRPVIMGHENIGTIARAGRNVRTEPDAGRPDSIGANGSFKRQQQRRAPGHDPGALLHVGAAEGKRCL